MRRVHALVVTLVVACLGALTAASARPASATTPAVPGTAVQAYTSCLSAQKQGDLLLLFDQSGSLQQTDPTAARVQAATFLLRQLKKTSGDLGAQLQVSVTGFDVGYVSTVPWQPLTDATLPAVVAGVEAYRSRNTGADTDYVYAVSGVRDDLRGRQRAQAQPRCQAVVLISDGQYDIDVRNTAAKVSKLGADKDYAPGVSLRSGVGVQQAEGLGRTAVCRQGGIADQLRSTGALTFAVGLGSSSDFALLRSMATGTDPVAGACGQPTPAPVGDFYLASNVSELVFAINEFGGAPPLDQESGVCPGTVCPAGTRSFVLDTSVRDVDVVAGVTEAGIDVLVAGPAGGVPVRFSYSAAPADQVVDGQRVHGIWLSDKQLQLAVTKTTDAGWSGQWSVAFVAPTAGSTASRARTQIRITGDLVPRLADAPVLPAVDGGTVHLGLASVSSKQAVPAATVLGTAQLSATLIGADGTELALAKGVGLAQGEQGIGADLASFPPGQAMLRLLLAVRTKGTNIGGVEVQGTQLADRQVDVPVTVQLPPSYPTTAGRVDFGRLEGISTRTASLAVTGPGCIWVASSVQHSAPDGVSAAVSSQAGSAATCRSLKAGERADLPLTLTTRGQGNGTISGTVELALATAPGAADTAKSKPIAFVADVARPVNKGRLAWVLALALVLGIGLPVLFLYAVKVLAAKIPGKGLRVGFVTVTVDGEQVLREGAPLELTEHDTRLQGVDPGGVRGLDLEQVSLRTRAGLSLTAPPYTQVVAPGRVVVTSEGSGRLPLGVHGTWTALVDEPTSSTVKLMVLLPMDATAESFQRLSRDVRDRLPGLLRRTASSNVPPGASPVAPPTGRAGARPTPPVAASSGSWSPAPPGGATWSPPPARVLPPPGSASTPPGRGSPPPPGPPPPPPPGPPGRR